MATWYDNNRRLVPVVPKLAPLSAPGAYDRNKTYIVTTIEEPPYLMRNNPDSPEFRANEPYKGFCEELARMISDKLEIKCKFIFSIPTDFLRSTYFFILLMNVLYNNPFIVAP